MAFAPSWTYQDYLSYLQNNPITNTEAGTTTANAPEYSESQWSSLTPSQQLQAMGGFWEIKPGDPQYQSLSQQIGGTISGPIMVQQGAGDNSHWIDPSRNINLGNGLYAVNQNNLSPQYLEQLNKMPLAGQIIMGLTGAAFGYGAYSALAGEGASAGIGGGASTDAAESGGTLSLNAAGTGVTPYSPISGAGFDLGPAGGLSPEETGGSGSVLNGGNTSTGLGNTGLNAGDGLSSSNTSVSSVLRNVNRARSVLSLLSGGNQGRGGMDLSSLLGGSGDGSGLMGLLGLLGLGYGLTGGGGVGTVQGLLHNSRDASNMADPWGHSGGRQHFIDELNSNGFVDSLLNPDPNAILNDPNYQFLLKEGTNTINMGDAAQGTLRSGNRGAELEKYGQGLASSFEDKYFNRNLQRLQAYEGLAGVNQSDPGIAAQMLMGGFGNASGLENGLLNSLFSGGSNNPLMSLLGGSRGGIGSLLGGLLSGGGSLLSSLFSGSNGTDWSSLLGITGGGDVSNMFDSGFGPSDFLSIPGGG